MDLSEHRGVFALLPRGRAEMLDLGAAQEAFPTTQSPEHFEAKHLTKQGSLAGGSGASFEAQPSG